MQDAIRFGYGLSANNRAHLDIIANWFLDQWSTPTAETIHDLSFLSPNVPAPVTVILKDELAGILSYKRYPVTEVSENALWINSLYVRADLRGLGIGSALLVRGMAHARGFGSDQLYVYTDVPKFYQAQGWQVFGPNNEQELSVLRYSNP